MGNWIATPTHLCSQVLTDHDDEVWHLQFSHDGTRLASAARDGTAIIWRVAGPRRRLQLEHTLKGHVGAVVYVAWAPNDALLATCGEYASLTCSTPAPRVHQVLLLLSLALFHTCVESLRPVDFIVSHIWGQRQSSLKFLSRKFHCHGYSPASIRGSPIPTPLPSLLIVYVCVGLMDPSQSCFQLAQGATAV